MALIKIVKVKKIIDALIEYVRLDYNTLKTTYKKLQITGVATTNGNLVLTVGATNYNIAVLTTDTIPNIITKILAVTYAGYTITVNGIDSVNFVTSGTNTAILIATGIATGITFEITDREEDTFLYRLLGDNTEGDYNFYTQSKEIFLRDDKNPRNIKTSLMFNKNTNGSPHIHVRESSRPKGSFNTLGGLDGTINLYEDGSFGENYRDTKRGVYEMLITSLNPLDTILIAEVIYTLMYGAYETLSNEFSLFDLSLKELIFQNTTAEQLYVKAINLETQQENTIPSIINNEILDKINFIVNNLNGVGITI